MTATYRPIEAIQLIRPCRVRRPIVIPRKRPVARIAFSTSRPAKTTHSSSSPPPPPPPPRKQISVASDTGAVRWSELSPAEKASRTVQQSFNLGIVLVGVVLTGAVGYFLFSDVLSPSSKTAYFNRATSAVRASPKCQQLLGEGSQIAAFGESSWSRWARNRFISSTNETDQWGTEHMKFRFYVEGPLGQGVVHAHLTKRPSQNEFEWFLLAVDVKGHQRVYLENAEGRKDSKVAPKIFGARWW
ncbi:TIM21-domain-containing protein [Corynespora cassiicola Philippines]|uniref:Mitochondrial import inner membrane translocase subunit Tim21 n=1 Tax=Corynespora cassiicola Philippines TaxID=1448308 RepID=A0A2T2NVH6_CORCC|nr:TIM21-domain-containing protein [Corynespora cassiicola Philippines]